MGELDEGDSSKDWNRVNHLVSDTSGPSKSSEDPRSKQLKTKEIIDIQHFYLHF